MYRSDETRNELVVHTDQCSKRCGAMVALWLRWIMYSPCAWNKL